MFRETSHYNLDMRILISHNAIILDLIFCFMTNIWLVVLINDQYSKETYISTVKRSEITVASTTINDY